MKRAGLDKAADDYQKSTTGRQNRRRKRQRAFALKRIRQTECHAQAYAYMCLHAAHAVCCKFVSLLHPKKLGFFFSFLPFTAYWWCHARTQISERISFVGNGRWCNWVERISFVGMEGDAIESNGFLLWVMEGDAIESNGFLFVGVGVVQLMQLSQHMWVCGWWAVL